MDSLPICVACGTLYETSLFDVHHCRICEDPRQYVPSNGQVWTTIDDIRRSHSNEWAVDASDEKVVSIWTQPKFAIGQRAMLLQTPHGNILWDYITLLDDETAQMIEAIGGLTAIVISHPHFYTTNSLWATHFQCPVYTSREDSSWHNASAGQWAKIIDMPTQNIVPGVTAIKCGGHFDGSLVLHWKNHLFHADTLMTVPSAYTTDEYRTAGMTSFCFMWSIPNSIPLDSDKIFLIWKMLRSFEFDNTHSAFLPAHSVKAAKSENKGITQNVQDLQAPDLKSRVLASMKIQVKAMGYHDHPLLQE